MDFTLSTLITQSIRRHGDRVALEFEDEQLTYRQLDEVSSRLATGLRSLGVREGDRVALYLRNCIQYVVADIALLKLGVIKVPLNQYQSASDVTHILDETRAVVLIAHDALITPLLESLRERAGWLSVIYVSEGPELPEMNYVSWEKALSSVLPVGHTPEKNDLAMIAYTGGTTGKPKGVVHTQEGLGLNVLAHIVSGDITADEVMLLQTPLPHSAGYHMQACLVQGGKIILGDSFTQESFYRLVEQKKVSWSFLVPTMIYRLLDNVDKHNYNHSSIKTIVYGAAPMSSVRLQQAIELFGLVFIQLFGQTECPNYITALTKHDHEKNALLGSCGKAVPFVQLKTNGEDGRAIGEVLVRSPYMLREYYQNREATEGAVTDGWLRTGDIGYLDENGYLFLKDRAKDMIITGGMNVYTTEVEQVLKKHPSIIDAAVVGVPHDDWGEQVHAVVVAKEGVTQDDLIQLCGVELARYKIPKTVEFRDAMPLTAYGKVDKKAIRIAWGN